MNQKLCTLHSYNYDKLEDKILSVIKPMLLKNIDLDKINLKAKEIYIKYSDKEGYKIKFDNIENSIKPEQEQLGKMYLEKLDYKITDEMYDRIKIKLDQEIQRLETDKNNIYKILMDSDNKKI